VPTAPYDGNSSLTGVSGWTPSTRELKLTGGTTTLTGNVYMLCHLELSNQAQLVIPPRPTSPVKIYMDKPENCPGSSLTQVDIGNQTKIVNLNSDPTSLVIFGPSGTAYRTSFVIDNGFSDEVPMVIYAPFSNVKLKNTAIIRGGVVANNVDLTTSAQVKFDPLAGLLTLDTVVPLYKRQSWVECKPLKTSTAADSGC
jgi:hypothetical protein